MEKKYYVVIMRETVRLAGGGVKVAYVPVKGKDGFDTYEEAEEWARRNAGGKAYNVGVYFE